MYLEFARKLAEFQWKGISESAKTVTEWKRIALLLDYFLQNAERLGLTDNHIDVPDEDFIESVENFFETVDAAIRLLDEYERSGEEDKEGLAAIVDLVRKEEVYCATILDGLRNGLII